MNRPTLFEIMRRRRQKLESAVEGTKVEIAWDAYRAELQADRLAQFADTTDWLRDTRDQARERVQEAADSAVPQLRRRVLGGLPMRLWSAIARVRRSA